MLEHISRVRVIFHRNVFYVFQETVHNARSCESTFENNENNRKIRKEYVPANCRAQYMSFLLYVSRHGNQGKGSTEFVQYPYESLPICVAIIRLRYQIQGIWDYEIKEYFFTVHKELLIFYCNDLEKC